MIGNIFSGVTRDLNTTISAVFGILAIVGGAGKLLFDGDPSTNPQWELIVPTLFALVSGLLAGGKKDVDD